MSGVLALLVGCGDPPPPSGVTESVGRSSSAVGAGGTVQDAVSSTGCSTIVVVGLSQQIVDEVNCLVPNALVAVPDAPNLVKSDTTFAFMQPPAESAFAADLAANPGLTMHVDSMLRTVAQQYLLYAWYLANECDIQLAATPGTSNHEQGLAFDNEDYSAWMTVLNNGGFQWYGAADVVHFDYVGGGAVNLDGTDVLAFQKLWNANNPSDTIDEDGQFGPDTEARLQKSPADGFATPVVCAPLDGGLVAEGGLAMDGGQREGGESTTEAGLPSLGDSGGVPSGNEPDGGAAVTPVGEAGVASLPPVVVPRSSGCACRTTRVPLDDDMAPLVATLIGLGYLLRRWRARRRQLFSAPVEIQSAMR